MLKSGRLLLWALVALVIVDLLVWISVGVLGKGSGMEMSDIAERILAGHGFSSPYLEPGSGVQTAVSPPLYVWLVTAVYQCLGVKTLASRIFLQCLNIVFHAVSLVLLYRICRDLTSERVARIFAVLFVVSPHIIFLASNVWESSLSLMLLSLVMYWVRFLAVAAFPGVMFGFGLLLGIVALANPVWSLWYPVICVGFGIARLGPNGQWRDWFRLLGTIVAGFLVVVVPWLLRNYDALHALIYIRDMSGPELFKGNNPLAGGGHGAGFVKYFLYFSPDELQRYTRLGEIGYDKAMTQAALHWILENPVSYIGLTLGRVLMWWTGDTDVAIWYFTSGHTREFYQSVCFIVIGALTSAFVLDGMRRLYRRGGLWWLLSVYVFLFPLPYYFIIVGFRYQSSLLPFALIPAAYSVSWLLHDVALVMPARRWGLARH